MNTRTAVAALAILVALTLTGCAGAAENAGGGSTAPETSESVAPLTAETSEPTAEALSPEDQYLVDVRKALTNGRETSIPNATDEQLLEAGLDACEQLASGVAEGDVRVVEGEQMDAQWGDYRESAIITVIATSRLC